jgi:hypothetical protein
MPTPTTYLKLHFQFDREKLQHDLSLITAENWISHFNTKGYSGDWKAISLYAPHGDEANIYAHSTNFTALAETNALNECHYFKDQKLKKSDTKTWLLPLAPKHPFTLKTPYEENFPISNNPTMFKPSRRTIY